MNLRLARLLLCDLDELCQLWDALMAHRATFDDPAAYELEVTERLHDRIGDLMAHEYDRQIKEGAPAEAPACPGMATADLLARVEAATDYWRRRWALRLALVEAYRRGRKARAT